MQHAHLACSEAFDVQLEIAGPLELVDGAPKMRIARLEKDVCHCPA